MSLLGFLACPWPASGAAKVDPAVTQLARGLLDARIAQVDRSLTTAIRQLLDTQELTTLTRQVVGGLSEDENFRRFLQQKAEAPPGTNELQIGRFVEEYMLTTTNVSPDVAAWFRLTSDLRTPWTNVYGAYLQLQANHAKELLPKLILINRPLRTGAEATNWLAVLKEAGAGAPSSRERILCLRIVAKRALNLAGIEGGQDCLADLSGWLAAQDKARLDEDQTVTQERRFAEFFVAFARRDFTRAAELARGPRLRTVRPLVLAMAGQPAAAWQAVDELKAEPTLTLREGDELNQVRAALPVRPAGERR